MSKNKISKAHIDKKKNLPLNSSTKQTDNSKIQTFSFYNIEYYINFNSKFFC